MSRSGSDVLKRLSRLGNGVVRKLEENRTEVIPKHQLTTQFKRSYGNHNYRKQNSSASSFTVGRAVTAAAVVGAAGMALYHSVQKKTEDNPVSDLKIFYINRFNDEKQKRALGASPAEFFKAAKKAMAENRMDDFRLWCRRMLVVHPTPDEVPQYKEAAEILFSHDELKLATSFWERTIDAKQLPAFMGRVGDRFLELNRVPEAIACLERHLDANEMRPYLKKAGDKSFQLKEVDEALRYWGNSVDAEHMPFLLEKVGNLCRDDLKDVKRAVNYWKMAEDRGLCSPSMSIQLAHQYW
jgi:tetratricopeptide (TPR) repeat protein